MKTGSACVLTYLHFLRPLLWYIRKYCTYFIYASNFLPLLFDSIVFVARLREINWILKLIFRKNLSVCFFCALCLAARLLTHVHERRTQAKINDVPLLRGRNRNLCMWKCFWRWKVFEQPFLLLPLMIDNGCFLVSLDNIINFFTVLLTFHSNVSCEHFTRIHSRKKWMFFLLNE